MYLDIICLVTFTVIHQCVALTWVTWSLFFIQTLYRVSKGVKKNSVRCRSDGYGGSSGQVETCLANRKGRKRRKDWG